MFDMPFLRGPLKVLHFFHILCKNYEFSVAGIGGNWVVFLAEYILQNWSDGTAHFLACSLAVLLQVPNI